MRVLSFCISVGIYLYLHDHNFYHCTMHLDNVKIPFLTTNASFIEHIKCLNLHESILYMLLHISVHLDHPQRAYTEPG